MKYSFNHAGPYVEIPELDTFLHEFRQLCKSHGIGYRLEQSSYGDSSFLRIVHFNRCDWDIFTESLSDYGAGVPFLDEAKLRWSAAVAKLEEEDEQRRLAQQRKLKDQEEMRKVRQESDLKRNGITLSDGVYRLVKDENASGKAE